MIWGDTWPPGGQRLHGTSVYCSCPVGSTIPCQDHGQWPTDYWPFMAVRFTVPRKMTVHRQPATLA